MDIDEATEILNRLGDIIAHSIKPDYNGKKLSVTPLKSSNSAWVFCVSIDDTKALVKIFADTDDAQSAFDRERFALEGFHEIQIPRLKFTSEPDRVLVMDFIEGATLNEIISDTELMRVSEHMGQWFGHMANAAPRQGSSGNWQGYFEEYDSGLNLEVLNQQKEILSAVEITHLALAHNDTVLSNFIIGSDTRLYGVDFENSRFKPEGWDLVMATRVLFMRFPDDLPMISVAMLRGYLMTVKNTTLPDNFDHLINAVIVANLVA